jgi:glycyl-tRNA synthetase
MTSSIQDKLKDIVALAKRRGFVYPCSEIYGGFANSYSFGPYGALLKKNIKDAWWRTFTQLRSDMVGLDGPILLHPKVWEASGHVAGFHDALVDCKSCKSRFRADHLIENALHREVEGLPLSEVTAIIHDNKIPCPKCKAVDWTDARQFNLMFHTPLKKTKNGEEEEIAYLRPETAQAIFIDFKNIIDTMRKRVPFGVAQMGKAFRNEITPGNFIFRVIEFEQMEIEYFIPPTGWESHFEQWLATMKEWCRLIGLKEEKLKLYEHPQDKLSHYSKRTVDILYEFPFGWSELYGLAYRTDFDLKQHAEHSKTKILYTDPETQEKYVPHVIEPTFGVERTFLALLCQSYEEQTLGEGDVRTVLHLPPTLAPIKVAVFPLMRKDGLAEIADAIFKALSPHFQAEYDEGGAIGKRYRRQDEIGTPFCVTIDYQTKEDGTVTLRHRDSMKQERVHKDELLTVIKNLMQTG